MTNVRATTYKAIQDNDISSVVFLDPFSSVTRGTKRNLLIASFVAIMVAVLQLEITGFLGLQASNANLGNALAQGLACLVVVYFLISFGLHAFVDYAAWQFQRERQLTQPYLDLIHLLESSVNVTGEQIGNACNNVNGITVEKGMESQVEAQKRIEGLTTQLNGIRERIAGLVEETRPLLLSWAATIKSMNRLGGRLRIRLLSLWAMDIIFPLALALFAIWRTRHGIAAVVEKIAS